MDSFPEMPAIPTQALRTSLDVFPGVGVSAGRGQLGTLAIGLAEPLDVVGPQVRLGPTVQDQVGQGAAESRRDRETADVATGDDVETVEVRDRADDELAVRGHRRQPAAVLADRRIAQDREEL